MDVFDEMFGTFRSSACRVETLSTYKIEGGEWEEFQAFKSGKVLSNYANQDWANQIATWTRGGKQIKRVRILPPDLNDYIRYELEWCYPQNNMAGEQFRFISERTYQGFSDPTLRGDYWLFDNKHVLLLLYDSDGSYKGEELVSDASVKPYVELFNQLEKVSAPLDHVLEQIRTSKIKIKLP